MAFSDLSSYLENNYKLIAENYLSNTGFKSEMLENKIIEIDGKRR